MLSPQETPEQVRGQPGLWLFSALGLGVSLPREFGIANADLLASWLLRGTC